MTTIREEIEQLQTQMAAQMQILSGMTGVLVEIRDAISGLSGGKTLADIWSKEFTVAGPITINGNAVFDPTTIVAAITALRGDGPENTIKSVNQSIWNVAGPAPGTNLTQLWNKIDAIHGGLGFSVSSLSLRQWLDNELGSGEGLTLYNMLDQASMNVFELVQLVTALNNAVGGVPNNSLEVASVRGLLNNIMTCACRTATALTATQGPNVDVCAQPYRSAGQQIDPVGQLVWATWSNPPSGITLTTPMALSGDFTGWRAWVTSKADQCAIESVVASTERYPTNRWITIPAGINTLQFSVSSQYGIAVTLCGPATQPGECRLITSEPWGSNQFGAWHGIRWGPDTETTFTTTGGLTFWQLDNDGTYTNYTVHIITQFVTVYWSTDEAQSGSPGPWPMTVSGTKFAVYGNEPFEVWFCPPNVNPPA